MNTSIFNEEFTGYLGVVVTPKRLVSGWRLAFTQSSVALPLSHEPLHCRSLDRSLLLIKFFLAFPPATCCRCRSCYLDGIRSFIPTRRFIGGSYGVQKGVGGRPWPWCTTRSVNFFLLPFLPHLSKICHVSCTYSDLLSDSSGSRASSAGRDVHTRLATAASV